jgi:transcriptional regulator with XRE-family HTH domain
MEGAELKEWRKKIGWTQANLMKELEVTSRQTISTWENAARIPRIVELAVIALDQVEPARTLGGFETQFTAKSIAKNRFQTFKKVREQIVIADEEIP